MLSDLGALYVALVHLATLALPSDRHVFERLVAWTTDTHCSARNSAPHSPGDIGINNYVRFTSVILSCLVLYLPSSSSSSVVIVDALTVMGYMKC